MHVTFVDDSFSFDGLSPTSRPLGGPEKALAYLPSTLAMRGHDVRVFNRCTFKIIADGAHWETWESDRPSHAEVLIAFRKAGLLEFVPSADRRILWITGDPASLEAPAVRTILAQRRPTIVFSSAFQRSRYLNRLELPTQVVAPGLAATYLDETPMEPADPPRAITTSHPLARLDWLLRVWVERIRPAVPTAELHVCSALLDRGRLGAEVPAAVAPILAQAVAAAPNGVIIRRPQGDHAMAEIYRAARVHLYPGQPNEAYAATLAETQATGLPAVAGASGPAVVERIIDGETGFICGDDERFATAAIELLGDRAAFTRMSEAARRLQRGRTWAVAAAEWEELLA
jgi:glycosyltransferase involved in cell wall biosynthesis